MIQHYLCKITHTRSDNQEILSIGSCDVWARSIIHAKELAAQDSRSQYYKSMHEIAHPGVPISLVEREIVVEEEIIPEPDEVMPLTGYDSGNGECWTFDVSAWDFERVTGNAPSEGEGSWDSPSIIEGLTEPYWQLGMDPILKWAGGRPIRFDVIPMPKVEPKVEDSPRSYDNDFVVCAGQATYYLTAGVLELFTSEQIEEMTDGSGQGQDGLVADLAQYAVYFEEWFVDNKLDGEDLTDGVMLYDIMEDKLPLRIRHFYEAEERLPNKAEFISILEGLRLKERA